MRSPSDFPPRVKRKDSDGVVSPGIAPQFCRRLIYFAAKTGGRQMGSVAFKCKFSELASILVYKRRGQAVGRKE